MGAGSRGLWGPLCAAMLGSQRQPEIVALDSDSEMAPRDGGEGKRPPREESEVAVFNGGRRPQGAEVSVITLSSDSEPPALRAPPTDGQTNGAPNGVEQVQQLGETPAQESYGEGDRGEVEAAASDRVDPMTLASGKDLLQKVAMYFGENGTAGVDAKGTPPLQDNGRGPADDAKREEVEVKKAIRAKYQRQGGVENKDPQEQRDAAGEKVPLWATTGSEGEPAALQQVNEVVDLGGEHNGGVGVGDNMGGDAMSTSSEVIAEENSQHIGSVEAKECAREVGTLCRSDLPKITDGNHRVESRASPSTSKKSAPTARPVSNELSRRLDQSSDCMEVDGETGGFNGNINTDADEKSEGTQRTVNTHTTRGTNGTRGTHGTRGTRATDVTREGPRLNKNRLKADLHTWLAEYKGREMKERRKDLQASIMKENRAKVVQIEEQKRQLRSNFFSNFRDSSDTPSIRAFGNDGEVVKEAVRKQTSKCWRILFKLHESLEVPTSTSWVMSKKNILTEHVTELEFVPHLGEDGVLPELYLEHHENKSYLPTLEERQTIKFLVDRAVNRHGASSQLENFLHDWVEANLILYESGMRADVISGMIPSCLPAADETSRPVFDFEVYPRVRNLYCKRCHMYNCLVHAELGEQKSSEYDREVIVENEFFIDKDTPKRRTPEPKKPQRPCDNDCCYHDAWEDSPQDGADNGKKSMGDHTSRQDHASACTNQSNSSDIPVDAPLNWKEQSVLLSSIYDGDCCKVGKILALPCRVICSYLRHKCKHEKRLEALDGVTSSKPRKPVKKKKGKRRRNAKNLASVLDGEDFNKYRYVGCNCKAEGGHCKQKSCPCFAEKKECDPDVCRCTGCKTDDFGPTGCCNRKLQTWNSTRLLVGKSNAHGWGVFIRDGAKKNDFLCEYTGERIASAEADRRGGLYDHKNVGTTFLFDLYDLGKQGSSDEHSTVDALRMGCKSKFVNHPPSGVKANCAAQYYTVMGDRRIGLAASRDIQPYEELFFDYSFNNSSKIEWFTNLKEKEDGKKRRKKSKSVAAGSKRKHLASGK